MADGQRPEGWVTLDARSAGHLGLVLMLIAIVAAATGHRELFHLTAEDSDRSVRRALLGTTQVLVTPDAPWARVPAWLPGPADQWAGGTGHAITVRFAPPAIRALLLDIRTSSARPFELDAYPAPPAGARARLQLVVNGEPVATFTVPAPGPPNGPSHASRRLHAAIHAAALGGQTPVTMSLLNDGGPGVGIERMRLVEAWPSVSVTHLRRTGRPSVATVVPLLLGLGILLWSRRARPGAGEPHGWRRARGPTLALLVVALAVASPGAVRWIPHWGWLLLILCVVPLGRRPASPATTRRRPARVVAQALGNVALALLALAVSLVVAEFALRAVFRDEPWVLSALNLHRPVAPNPLRTNSLGFDEREFPLVKPPGVYRIAVLGDSLSVSAPRTQRFGSVIAQRLNTEAPAGVTYEALNFGRTGIDTEEETEILRQSVWRAHPDFVLLEWYVNDLENGDYSERPGEPLPFAPDSLFGRWLDRLTVRTVLRRLVREEYSLVLQHLDLAETYPAYMHRLFAEPASPRWPIADRALRAFIGESRIHHTPLAIALFPHLSAGLPAGTYEFAELHDQVLELCRQENVPCVDLRSTFAARRDFGNLWVHRFDPHPNALAHRLAAERLVEVLGAYWLAAGRGSGPAAQADVSRGGGRGSAASRSRRS